MVLSFFLLRLLLFLYNHNARADNVFQKFNMNSTISGSVCSSCSDIYFLRLSQDNSSVDWDLEVRLLTPSSGPHDADIEVHLRQSTNPDNPTDVQLYRTSSTLVSERDFGIVSFMRQQLVCLYSCTQPFLTQHFHFLSQSFLPSFIIQQTGRRFRESISFKLGRLDRERGNFHSCPRLVTKCALRTLH